MASSNGDVCIVDALLRRGAHINHKDQVCLKEEDGGGKNIYSVLVYPTQLNRVKRAGLC